MTNAVQPVKRVSIDTEEAPPAAIRGRAFVIGALLAAFTAYLVTQAEMVLSSLRIGYLQFPPAALGLLLLIVAINRGIKRISAKASLSSSDELVIYTMLVVAAMVSSHGIVQKWIPLLVAPKYFSNDSNAWHTLYHPYIKSWLVPWDPHNGSAQQVVTSFYEKLARGEGIPWHAWLVPLFSTGILIGLVIFAFLCLAAILRRQWVDNEKLSFPLAQLPLEIANDEGTGSFFNNRLMWLGAAIPTTVYFVNEMHRLAPTVPEITLVWGLGQYFTTSPWNGPMAGVTIFLSFAAVGFFFLLPTDILFSLWFFYALSILQQVIAGSYNMPAPAMPLYGPPAFIGYQTVGAYCVLVAYFIKIASPHLKRVWRAAIGKEQVDDSNELLPYRVAFWGLIGSVLLSSVFMWIAGMSLWLALLEFVVFMGVIAVVMARSTAEAGMLMTETTFRPIDLYRMVGSIHGLGPANLTMLAFLDNLFLRDQRGLVLTGFLDGLKIADGANVRRRSLFGAFVLAISVALVVAVVANIGLAYTLSANKMDMWMEQQSPALTWNDYQQYFKASDPLDHSLHWQMPVFFGVGGLVTIFLTAMRAAFFWWPLHPLGYALAGSWSIIVFWFPCFLAWIFKALTVRYGGMTMYTKARPFFLGLVIGEFASAVVWVILYILFKVPPPSFPWA